MPQFPAKAMTGQQVGPGLELAAAAAERDDRARVHAADDVDEPVLVDVGQGHAHLEAVVQAEILVVWRVRGDDEAGGRVAPAQRFERRAELRPAGHAAVGDEEVGGAVAVQVGGGEHAAGGDEQVGALDQRARRVEAVDAVGAPGAVGPGRQDDLGRSVAVEVGEEPEAHRRRLVRAVPVAHAEHVADGHVVEGRGELGEAGAQRGRWLEWRGTRSRRRGRPPPPVEQALAANTANPKTSSNDRLEMDIRASPSPARSAAVTALGRYGCGEVRSSRTAPFGHRVSRPM
jgi:hypothetical protein